MTPVQYRMARAALNWTTRKVAAVAAVPIGTAAALEAGKGITSLAMNAIREAFEAEGLTFIDDVGRGPGVCFKAADDPEVSLKRKPAGAATDAIERMEAEVAADRG